MALMSYSWFEANMWWIAIIMICFMIILLLFPVFIGYDMKKEEQSKRQDN